MQEDSPEVTVCCLGETANVGWIPADELPYARRKSDGLCSRNAEV